MIRLLVMFVVITLTKEGNDKFVGNVSVCPGEFYGDLHVKFASQEATKEISFGHYQALSDTSITDAPKVTVQHASATFKIWLPYPRCGRVHIL